jgi:hypothetical protein
VPTKRRLAALLLALVPLLAAGCSPGSGSDPDNEALESAVTAFVQTLERGAYDDAHALLCPSGQTGRAGTDAAALREEFEPHPRPWKRKIWATSRSNDHGAANIALTPSGQAKHEYAFDLVRTGGAWQVCDVTSGSFDVDVG